MEKLLAKVLAKVTAVLLICTAVLTPVANVKADAVETTSYISFGADLSEKEKSTVMGLLDISEAELDNYEVVEVTNDEEKKYLGDYLSANVIGTRALSSVRVDKGEEGSGIGVETKNITYCTAGMYSNALITAGIEDADVVVAGPFNISGTAALVGAMKAYSAMTGEEFDQEKADAATNELVDTAELAKEIGPEEAEQLVALAKQKVISGELKSTEDIEKAIEEAAKSLDISLTAQQKQKLISLLDKIKDLDIDVNSLKEQAKDMYNKIKDLGIEMDDAKNFLEKVASFFSDLGRKIADFFDNLFG